MNCRECLVALETGSLRDLTADSAVMRHCARCPDCGPLATLLRDREYNAANLLNSLPPMSNPVTLAEDAMRISQRRRLGRVAVMVSGAALVATIWIAAATIFIPMMSAGDRVSTLHTETIALSCLSPQQAGDIISPYVRARGSTYYVPSSGISAITVRGLPTELAKSRDLIRAFESDPNASCRADGNTFRKLQDQLDAIQRATDAPRATGRGERATPAPLGPSPIAPPLGQAPAAAPAPADQRASTPKKR
ncbi:MAG: hypothetical protein ABI469_04830 [Gemmatimonadales bacterium]